MFTKKLLIWKTLLGVLTLGSVAAAQEGNKYVLDSLEALLAMRTVECDIRIETYVDGNEYLARGRYVEQVLPQTNSTTFLRSMYRLEIKFWNPLLASDASLNQMTLVCYVSEENQKHLLEQYTSIEGDNSFRTIDLNKLEDCLKETKNEMFFRQASEVRNLGGLAGMMRQISRFYDFAQPTQENLQEDEKVSTWKLTGTLKNVHRQNLLTQFGGLTQNGQYPADFPSDIEIWIDTRNNFPYKIRYLRRSSEKSDKKKVLLHESFSNVILNGPSIPTEKFSPLPVPEDVFSTQDETEKFIKTLNL